MYDRVIFIGEVCGSGSTMCKSLLSIVLVLKRTDGWHNSKFRSVFSECLQETEDDQRYKILPQTSPNDTLE